MRTVIETQAFHKQAKSIWSEDEYFNFITWISLNPDAGDVIQNTSGARKVRWRKSSRGKSGGVRVIYYHFSDDQIVLLILIYEKSKRSNVLAKYIKDRKG